MTLEQLIDMCAAALYEQWAAEEAVRLTETQPQHPGIYRQRIRERNAMWPALPTRSREVWRARARPMVIALERQGKLKVGMPRVYDVRLDDPSLDRVYEYEQVEAFSAQAAAIECARRALAVDGFPRRMAQPSSGVQVPFGAPYGDDIALEHPALIDDVAMHARVRRSDRQDEPWVYGEGLWAGYRDA